MNRVSVAKTILLYSIVALIIGGNLGWRHFYRDRHGLKAEYFSDKKLMVPAAVKRSDSINYFWGRKNALNGFWSDDFSVRWTGFLVVPETNAYKFVLNFTGAGARFWIDDKPVIDQWTSQENFSKNVSLHLEKGPHSIRIDYANEKYAFLRLLWNSTTSNELTPVPASVLVPHAEFL
jgi:PA14 domain